MEKIQADKDVFNIWLPVKTVEEEIQKSETGETKKVMRLEGIASTDDIDLDNQTLLNEGFDIDYLLQKGFINWHHQSKFSPSAIIGEPIDAKVTKKGLFVKGELYDTPIARDAYELAKVLEKQSKTRRLGWSIEGKMLEKSGDVITKAKITGIALTHSPKNPHTFAELAKAMTDGSTTKDLLSPDPDGGKFVIETEKSIITFDKAGNLHLIEKAMTTDGGGQSLKKESLEGGKNNIKRTNVDLLNRIFKKYPNITLEKSLQVANKVLEKRLRRKNK